MFIPREARLRLWKNNPNPFSEGLRIFQCVLFSNFKKKLHGKRQKDKVLFSPQIVVALLLQTLNSEQSAILGSVFLFFFSLSSFLLSFLLYFFLCMYYVCRHISWLVCGGQRTVCRSRFFLFTRRALGIKLKKSGCVLSSFLLSVPLASPGVTTLQLG